MDDSQTTADRNAWLDRLVKLTVAALNEMPKWRRDFVLRKLEAETHE